MPVHTRRRPQRHFGIALALFAVLGAVSARADKPKLRIERADVSKYPLLRLYMTLVESDGRVMTGKTKDDFKLVFDSNEGGSAADAKTIDQTGEPVYVVIVAQAQAMHDVFDDVKRGVKTVVQAAADLKGSKVGLITFGQEQKRVELSKPEEIETAVSALVEDDTGSEIHLLDSIRTAIDMLNAKGVPDTVRKLIVVFSDGIDVAGTDKKGFAELGKRAMLADSNGTTSPIVIDTIGYATFEPGKLRNLFELSKQTNGTDRTCKSAQEVSAQFSNVADELKKQYVVLFQSIVAGDSKDHGIQVLHGSGGTPVYSNTVSKICTPPIVVEEKGHKWWWWLLVIGLPVLLLLGLVIYLIGRRTSEEQPVDAPMAAPEPAKESSAQRTMAMDVSNLGKGPTVGWIVGMNGKYADRTFKLLPQRTVIGTSTEADIQLEDQKLSRKHCEIRFDGMSYKIVDLGSTNGIVLNDKKTPQGDLIDGDLFRLGGTEFKFKSIN